MQLVSIPANPVPEGALVGDVKTPDGVTLRFARWAPLASRKGTVCVFGGRTEFIEKYFETVRDLRARGFAVAALDWRGQGFSQRLTDDPLKGHIRDFSEYETDLDAFMRDVVLPDCPPPVFALAHSMGAMILIRSAHRGMRWFDRIVLSAPMLALSGLQYAGMARVATTALRLFGMGERHILRRHASIVAGSAFAGNLLTSDPVRYARNAAIVEAEPALAVTGPTVAWMDAAFRAMAECTAPDFAAHIRHPLLIVAAGHDEVVSTAAIEAFVARLRSGSHLIVPGARHELLMEQDRIRNQFWAAFDAFVPGTPLY